MQKIHVLVVDDEWNMRNLLRIYLSKSGFQVTEASGGSEALSVIKQSSFDLIILDVMMPDMDGWDVCKKIRKVNQSPILMLTARTETQDKVHGFNVGADDYVVKPFEPEELIARVFALIRRAGMAETQPSPIETISYRGILIDSKSRQVFVNEQPVEYTPKEFELLRYMAEHPNRAFSREVLLEQVWGDDYFGDIRTVDTHVKNIREKLRQAGLNDTPVQTVWGVGYRFHAIEDRDS
ncbi:response regulator transcription factor [Paenibacillus filicis]|uniref:Response regulator transcription factor n=1 Tax=Paenibacillus filicis TaxID=669464 RepID=A0ABU9DNX1_9BACL